MGRKRISEDEKMQDLKIRVPGWMKKKLQQEENYSALIRSLVEEYLLKKGK